MSQQKGSIYERFKAQRIKDLGFPVKTEGRRPHNPKDCKSLGDAERWRAELISDITRKITKISAGSLSDDLVRDLNDDINRKLDIKLRWEYRIRELGGPDYIRRSNNATLQGVCVPGTKGYRYFGRAKDLPGVKELFEEASQMQAKVSVEEINRRVDADYFGFRDEDDGILLAYEEKIEAEEIRKIIQACSSSGAYDINNHAGEINHEKASKKTKTSSSKSRTTAPKHDEMAQFLARDFVIEDDVPTVAEIEAEMVKRKREELLKKVLG